MNLKSTHSTVGRPPRSIAFLCMPEEGHFQRVLPLIQGLARRGAKVSVFTHHKFAGQITRIGAQFFDLFSKYPLDQADDESLPVPSRFVSFAGVFGDPVVDEVAAVKPSLIVHDTFAVIGRLVAERLGLPRINVCAGHNVAPAPFLAMLKDDPRVRTSPRCLRAVEILRTKYDMPDASPFSYITSLSPSLNIYCEPPQYLDENERKVFEPVVFYGSLPTEKEIAPRPDLRNHFNLHRSNSLRVYISFGTVIWRYYAPAALQALETLAETFSKMEGVEALISLGGAAIGAEGAARLRRSNVMVETYIDQWRLLQEADLFLTHHGLNSTHEAVYHRVPMISYPFFWDQPALAEKCRSFGLAFPLTGLLRGPLDESAVVHAIERFQSQRPEMIEALALAKEWEENVIDGRESVLDQMLSI